MGFVVAIMKAPPGRKSQKDERLTWKNPKKCNKGEEGPKKSNQGNQSKVQDG